MISDDLDLDLDDNFFESLVHEGDRPALDCCQPQHGVKRNFSDTLSSWEPYEFSDMTETDPAQRSSSSSESASVSSESHPEQGGPRGLDRKMFRLERNRESATRCRQKKKNELKSLTTKITELLQKISILNQENAALRADNLSLTDHNRFLRDLLSAKMELPQHVSAESNSMMQPGTSAASGIAILGMFGAITVFSKGASFFAESSSGGGRVLDNPLEDLLQERDGSPLHLFVVGIFLCLIMLVSIQYGFSHVTVEKKELLPSHKKEASLRHGGC